MTSNSPKDHPPRLLPRGPRKFDIKYFPGLEAHSEVVELYRQRFTEAEEQRSADYRQSSLDTHLGSDGLQSPPVISIIGPRGTGKTSAILSLIEHLHSINTQDLIIFQPIDPLRFANADRLVNWVLAALDPEVRRVTEALRHGCGGSPSIAVDTATVSALCWSPPITSSISV